jgi:hypothetical protein
MTSPLEQKKIKIAGPSIVTANRTWDGAVIYRTASQGWSSELDQAAIVRTSGNGKVEPGNLRELIRRSGVTIGLPAIGLPVQV